MAGKALINGVYVPTVVLTQAQNSILRPERAQEFESGADAAFSYDGSYVEMQPYNGIGAQDVNASLAAQAYGILNTPAANLLYSGGDPQTISDLRFNSASVALMLPAMFARSLRASSATISLQGSNLAVWTKYRGRDPGLTANPLTEGLVDTGALTPTPRLYVLQLNLMY
jgi:hypothetical protein